MRKYISILLIIITITSCITITANAAEWQYPFPDCYELVQGKNYYLLYTDNTANPYMLVTWETNVTLSLAQSATYPEYYYPVPINPLPTYESITINYPFTTFCKLYQINNNTWTEIITGTFRHILTDKNQTYYSNVDVNYHSSNGTNEIFFQSTPLALSPYRTTILMGTVFQIVGLIPYLAVFLIGLVAFWKAWQFLLQQLRTA